MSPLTNRDVLEHVHAFDYCTIDGIAARFCFPGRGQREHIRRILREMVERGQIEAREGGRGALYYRPCAALPLTPRFDPPPVTRACGWCGAWPREGHTVHCVAARAVVAA